MQIQGHRVKLLEGLLADIVRSKLSFSMATACVNIVAHMEAKELLAAVPPGKHCPVLCVGTLIVVSGWGAELGFVSLRNAVFNAVDVSYEPPPSPPTTTGARASTNMPAPCIC